MGKHRDDAADAGARRFFHYVGNIVFDISGISTKVSHDNTWRSHFCSGVRQTVEMPENVENLTNYCFLIELKSQTNP